ncbi:MAG: histidine phosphatase family protein [Comamonadaceae bacterium CG_4_9_14_3_um_filter_60_33]|nr:MAG: histidine phosphatase family protein [Comamonadaceae bacterium CG2_30_59_20]PIY29461.1 MAG: histidine phosphatase family protein [Comamonadaceae bacterium CG_4_10_14_3_um_filter_60_42]PJB41840.1 MAG: histidine phosphatase family protein [Comamonadaceae bacterium CG_4_9_14_3_um_filter_60_33]
MSSLYLVRHGQASFGADDYDQLSDLGKRQSVQLGRYFAGKGIRFDAVLSGTLKRHTQTLNGISEGLGLPLPATQWPGLNEYSSDAVIAAVHPVPLDRSPTPDNYRQYFRLLRSGLLQWMLGNTEPTNTPDWQTFGKQVIEVLDHVRQSQAERVLLVSSGGPIASAIGHVLATPPEATIELNMRLRNTAVTEFSFTPKRHALLTYNTLPHLEQMDYAEWVSHA